MKIFIAIFCVQIIIFKVCPGVGTDFEFSKKYVCVVVAPFVRHKNETTGLYPAWDISTYKMEEIKNMLRLISTKFHIISTYASGAINSTAEWNEGDPNGLIPVAASEVNSENHKKVLTVYQGIWRNFEADLNDPVLKKEINNAFNSSEIANTIFPETVKGLIFTTYYVRNDETATSTIKLINLYRERAEKDNLKIGVQTINCFDVIQKVRPEVDNNMTNTDPEISVLQTFRAHYLERLVKHLDFIICQEFPLATVIRNNMKSAVDEMGKKFEKFTKIFKKYNSNLDVMWETGWPSKGLSDNGSKNTEKNLREYWMLMSKWAEKNNITVIFHEAFDQPWKISNPEDTSSSIGINGANSHYGWWERVNDSDITPRAYREKVAETETEDEGTIQNSAFIAIGVGCIIIIPTIIILSVRLHRAEKKINKLTEEEIEEFEMGIENPTPSEKEDYFALCLPYDKSFEIERNKFKIDETQILGQGQFGTVYKGIIKTLNEEEVVAIKVPNKNYNCHYLKEMLGEIKLMIYINEHKNVVTIKAAFTAEIRNGVVMIFSEFCELGSLENYLRSIPQEAITINDNNCESPPQNGASYVDFTLIKVKQKFAFVPNLFKWSHEIAMGMSYLASKKIIHADLATRNVLLTNEKIAKITDFGLSRRLYSYTEYIKTDKETPLPWRTLSPESLRILSFTEKSDVWSFGITMWEIFSMGTVPYPGLSFSVNFVDQLEIGLRMQKPKYASDDIYAVMKECWEYIPEKRPNFETLEETLENLRENDEFYI